MRPSCAKSPFVSPSVLQLSTRGWMSDGLLRVNQVKSPFPSTTAAPAPNEARQDRGSRPPPQMSHLPSSRSGYTVTFPHACLAITHGIACKRWSEVSARESQIFSLSTVILCMWGRGGGD